MPDTAPGPRTAGGPELPLLVRLTKLPRQTTGVSLFAVALLAPLLVADVPLVLVGLFLRWLTFWPGPRLWAGS